MAQREKNIRPNLRLSRRRRTGKCDSDRFRKMPLRPDYRYFQGRQPDLENYSYKKTANHRTITSLALP